MLPIKLSRKRYLVVTNCFAFPHNPEVICSTLFIVTRPFSTGRILQVMFVLQVTRTNAVYRRVALGRFPSL